MRESLHKEGEQRGDCCPLSLPEKRVSLFVSAQKRGWLCRHVLLNAESNRGKEKKNGKKKRIRFIFPRKKEAN